jgi:hypothetical protein
MVIALLRWLLVFIAAAVFGASCFAWLVGA